MTPTSSTAVPARRANLLQGGEGASSSGQSSLFDAIEAREDGIARAGAHADAEWWDAAFAAIVCAACAHLDFTADDVRDRIDLNVTTHQPAALGHVFRAAQRAGLIRKAGYARMTRDPVRHRELTVWTRA